MLAFISHGVAGKADTPSGCQLVGSTDYQPVVRHSSAPAAYCVSDVKLHKASGSVRKDGDCLSLLRCTLGVNVIQSEVWGAPPMTIVVSLGAGGLRFLPRFFHQVNLKKGQLKASV